MFVNTGFSAKRPVGSAVELELCEAVALPRHQSGRGEKFSLLFRGPADPPLSQGMVRLEHAGLGVVDLFLVPVVSTRPQECHYEAVINREAT